MGQWTYTDPSNSSRDAVRYHIGDTDVNDKQFSDGEIDYLLSNNSDDVGYASIEGVEYLIAKYSRFVDEKVGPLEVKNSQRVEGYEKLLETLKNRFESTKAPLYVGGIIKSDKDAAESLTDRVEPIFSKDMHKNVNKYPNLLGNDD